MSERSILSFLDPESTTHERRRQDFLGSREVRDRVLLLLERRPAPFAKGQLTNCTCALFTERVADENRYVYRIVRFSCQRHPVGEPILFMVLQADEHDPFNADKLELVGIEQSIIAAQEPRGTQSDARPAPALTRYRDIERLHEDEADVNYQKFSPGTAPVPEGVEITADNWMDYI
jgi:hypothetical protein